MITSQKEWANRGLGSHDLAILKAAEKMGGKATWTQLVNQLVPAKMARRTFGKHLKALVWSGFMAKRKERVNGKQGSFYVLQSQDRLDIFKRMSAQLNEEAQRLQTAIQQPGLSVVDHGKRLIDGVHMLLAYQHDLTLEAIRLALSAPSEEQAAHRFLVLMDTFTVDAAGNAMWLCWLNKDIAAGVLEAMLPKGEG